MMNTINLDERLARIESLLLSQKKVLNLDEACDYTGMSRSYLYKLTSTGCIPHSKPGGKLIYFDIDLLKNWLLENQRKSHSQIEQEALEYTLKKRWCYSKPLILKGSGVLFIINTVHYESYTL